MQSSNLLDGLVDDYIIFPWIVLYSRAAPGGGNSKWISIIYIYYILFINYYEHLFTNRRAGFSSRFRRTAIWNPFLNMGTAMPRMKFTHGLHRRAATWIIFLYGRIRPPPGPQLPKKRPEDYLQAPVHFLPR
jgi:hypothetical protein